jgi:hypothetical protein
MCLRKNPTTWILHRGHYSFNAWWRRRRRSMFSLPIQIPRLNIDQGNIMEGKRKMHPQQPILAPVEFWIPTFGPASIPAWNGRGGRCFRCYHNRWKWWFCFTQATKIMHKSVITLNTHSVTTRHENHCHVVLTSYRTITRDIRTDWSSKITHRTTGGTVGNNVLHSKQKNVASCHTLLVAWAKKATVITKYNGFYLFIFFQFFPN